MPTKTVYYKGCSFIISENEQMDGWDVTISGEDIGEVKMATNAHYGLMIGFCDSVVNDKLRYRNDFYKEKQKSIQCAVGTVIKKKSSGII